MPIYEFKCDECGGKFSEIRRMGDDQQVTCQQCGSTKTRKLISSFSSISSGTASGCASASRCSHGAGGG